EWGNPAGVIKLEDESLALSSSLMQHIASELGFSESVFIGPQLRNVVDKGSLVHQGKQLRFFTPTKEINACAHATLAAAHVLSDQNFVGALNFQTSAGIVVARRHKAGFIEMEQNQPQFIDYINSPQEIA